MAEVLPILGAVASALAWAGNAKGYVDSIRGAPDTVKSLSADLAAIETPLQELCSLVQASNLDATTRAQLSPILDPALKHCQKVSQDVQNTLLPYVRPDGAPNRNVWKRLSFTFKAAVIKSLEDDLARCKTTLSMAVNISNILIQTKQAERTLVINETTQRSGRALKRLQNHFDIETSSHAESEFIEDIHAFRQDITRWVSRIESLAEEDVEDVSKTATTIVPENDSKNDQLILNSNELPIRNHTHAMRPDERVPRRVRVSHDPPSHPSLKQTKPQTNQELFSKSKFTWEQVIQHVSDDNVSKAARNNEVAGPQKQSGEVPDPSQRAPINTSKVSSPHSNSLPPRIERDELAIGKAFEARHKLSIVGRDVLDRGIFLAVRHGHGTRHIRDLVNRGADVNSKFGVDTTNYVPVSVLCHEIMLLKRPDVLTFLFERGVDPNSTAGDLGPVLSLAAQRGHDAIVRRLLVQGADPNALGGCYGSPWQAAQANIKPNRHDIIQVLKEHGAIERPT